MKTHYILLAVAALALSSCVKTVEIVETIEKQMTVHAYQEGSSETKTAVVDGGTQVYWEPSDEVAVFSNGACGRFVSQNDDLATVAAFAGTLNYFLGSNEGEGTSTILWGLYPYRDDAVSDGESVTTTLPAAQVGRAGSFAKNTHISLACSNSHDLRFYNVTGGIRFSLTQDGITKVVFRGNNNEALAGRIKVSFVAGVPALNELSEVSETVVLTLPDDAAFQTGEWYYISTIPTKLANGFTVTFYKGDKTATLFTNNDVSISRGIFGSVAAIDEGLVFGTPGVIPGSVGEPVNLGLSVNWASWNVGASSAGENGLYFAWAETEAKSNYSYSTYKYYDGDLVKYSDEYNTLDPEDDAARVNWGGGWRTPTRAEWEDLIENCDWIWSDEGGQHGYKVVSKMEGYTDKFIFLPPTGFMSGTWFYPQSTVYAGDYYGTYLTANLETEFAFSEGFYRMQTGWTRCDGHTVRPVCSPESMVNSVSLDKPELFLYIGGSSVLEATVLPETAVDRTVSWESDNESVATVSQAGEVTAVSEGTAIVTVTTHDRGLTAKCVVTVSASNVGQAVDLGLSVKWASFNVGASAPEESGDYFAWGETESKSVYSYSTYKYYESGFTKYNSNHNTLEPEDDPATVNWGGAWRTPTRAEWEELMSDCEWIWSTEGSQEGYKVVGTKEGYTEKYIFLPATGFMSGTRFYPQSTVYSGKHYGTYFTAILETELAFSEYFYRIQTGWTRCDGHTVRPVCP